MREHKKIYQSNLTLPSPPPCCSNKAILTKPSTRGLTNISRLDLKIRHPINDEPKWVERKGGYLKEPQNTSLTTRRRAPDT